MTKKEFNLNNTKSILKLAYNLEKLAPYMKNKKIVNWVKEDINEIYSIQKELQKKGKLEDAYTKKETTNIKINKNENIENRILDIYNIINIELNSWRNINLDINMQ
jgi:hypothetical protein